MSISGLMVNVNKWLKYTSTIFSVMNFILMVDMLSGFMIFMATDACDLHLRPHFLTQLTKEVVADFIERSQRNAGYLVSFNNLWKAPG